MCETERIEDVESGIVAKNITTNQIGLLSRKPYDR